MTKCKACQREIAKAAKSCPGCGAPNASGGGGVGKWIALGVVGLVIAGAVSAADKKKKQKEEVATGANALDVTAQQLHADYKANEVSADAKYKGKVLRVSGKVERIAKDFSDDPYLEITTGALFENVHAEFIDEGALGTMSKGQQVTIRCRGNNVILGSPRLKDCIIDSANTAPAPKAGGAEIVGAKPASAVVEQIVDVTAKQLFVDYQANEVSADTKYRGKLLRVSGRVSRIGKDILDGSYVALSTPDDFSSAIASFKIEGELASLKKRQQVTLLCRGKGTNLGSPMLSDCAIQQDAGPGAKPEIVGPDPAPGTKRASASNRFEQYAESLEAASGIGVDISAKGLVLVLSPTDGRDCERFAIAVIRTQRDKLRDIGFEQVRCGGASAPFNLSSVPELDPRQNGRGTKAPTKKPESDRDLELGDPDPAVGKKARDRALLDDLE